MCGITGWIDWEQDLTRQGLIIEKMVSVLAARGPDDSGKWLSPRAALGHRRLSVVDPEGGAQPMIKSRDGRTYVISYNGELYNTSEVRNELISKGYTFRSHCDTEVVLAAYMEWGAQSVVKLNGIFAIAIWSEADQTLFLARDRLGVKPLFYTQRGKSFLFGSELKALLANPMIRPVIAEDGLAEILIMGPSRTPGHGIYKGIHELRPGYYLLYTRRGVQHKRYWSLVSRPHLDNLDDTTYQVRELLQDSIERQLVSDVPICTLLSGGLDSSAITAYAANAFRENGMEELHTYSIDYVDNDQYFQASEYQPNSDNPWVERVSKYLKTKHHAIVVEIPKLVESLIEATIARDLPGMADVDSALYLFCCEVKKGATVALSGECADEIFGGYPWFHQEEALNTPMFPWIRFLDHRLSLWNPSLFKEINPQEYIKQRYKETIAEVPVLEGESPLEKRRREISYLNILWFMTTLLERKDRMSMATGLEVRVPYSDHRLLEYVWNIPWEMKTTGNMAKGILRRALKGVLPEDVLERKKSPFPKTHNPIYTEAVRKWLTDIINKPSSPIHALINDQNVRALLNSKEDAFDRPFFGQLMKVPQLFAYLIQLNIWLKEYKVIIS